MDIKQITNKIVAEVRKKAQYKDFFFYPSDFSYIYDKNLLSIHFNYGRNFIDEHGQITDHTYSVIYMTQLEKISVKKEAAKILSLIGEEEIV